jgi:hypothetical protein
MKPLFALVLASLSFVLPVRAGLEFEKTEIAHTAKHSDTEVAKDFKFKVTGGKTIQITDIETYCNCLKAKTKDDKKEFKDGEEGVIETAFLLGVFEGEVAKQVVVRTDDPAQPEITLTVKMTIPQIYKVEPESLRWEVGEEPKSKTMKLTVLDEKEIAVTGLVSSRESMAAEFKVLKKGREYEITLTPKTTAEPMLGVLRVETDAPYDRYKKRLVFFNVMRPKAAAAPAAGAAPKP